MKNILSKIKALITLSELSPERKREFWVSVLSLFIVTASSALILSGIYSLVEGVIEERREAPILAAAARVMPADRHVRSEFDTDDVNGVEAVYEAMAGDTVIGYCVHSIAEDFNGEMTVVSAVDMEGKIVAVEVVSMPDGVGTKVRNSSFLAQFALKSGKVESVSEVKNESQIVAVSGATASSKAVTECVNHALSAVSQIFAEKAKEAVTE